MKKLIIISTAAVLLLVAIIVVITSGSKQNLLLGPHTKLMGLKGDVKRITVNFQATETYQGANNKEYNTETAISFNKDGYLTQADLIGQGIVNIEYNSDNLPTELKIYDNSDIVRASGKMEYEDGLVKSLRLFDRDRIELDVDFEFKDQTLSANIKNRRGKKEGGLEVKMEDGNIESIKIFDGEAQRLIAEMELEWNANGIPSKILGKARGDKELFDVEVKFNDDDYIDEIIAVVDGRMMNAKISGYTKYNDIEDFELNVKGEQALCDLEYTYDSKGNWVKCVGEFNLGKKKMNIVTSRKILYY